MSENKVDEQERTTSTGNGTTTRAPRGGHRLLGRGGSAEVYEVLRDDGRPFAVKVVSARNAEELGCFQQEVDLLMRFRKSPHVVHCYRSRTYEEDHRLYILLECARCDFRTFLKQTGEQLSLTEVLLYWAQCADAVATIHAEGIVHFDLKPGNFLLFDRDDEWGKSSSCSFFGEAADSALGVTPGVEQGRFGSGAEAAGDPLSAGQNKRSTKSQNLDFGSASPDAGCSVTDGYLADTSMLRVKLSDFGLASVMEAEKTHISRENQCGTVRYMAPETLFQPAGGLLSSVSLKLRTEADIWSLGIILYEMVYQRTPFDHLNRNVLAFGICDKRLPIDFPPLPERFEFGRGAAENDDLFVRETVSTLLQECLERDPTRRPTAARIQEKIKDVLLQLGAGGIRGGLTLGLGGSADKIMQQQADSLNMSNGLLKNAANHHHTAGNRSGAVSSRSPDDLFHLAQSCQGSFLTSSA